MTNVGYFDTIGIQELREIMKLREIKEMPFQLC